MYNHTINTTLGKFRFGWVNDKTWICGKFENPTLAKEVYTCNPFNGKYNFHGVDKSYKPIDELINFLEGLRNSKKLIKVNLVLDDFQQFIADQINSVMEVKLYWYYKNMDTESQNYLYKLTCKRACLNPKSEDVQTAFNYLFAA